MLIGLGKMIKKIAGPIGPIVSLLASKIMGTLQHITIPGGSGYYTTTIGSNGPGYVSISNYGSYVKYSTDGLTWKRGSLLPVQWGWQKPIFHNDQWWTITTSNSFSQNSYTAKSTDGVNWTATAFYSYGIGSGGLIKFNGRLFATSFVDGSISKTYVDANNPQLGERWQVLVNLLGGPASPKYVFNNTMVLDSFSGGIFYTTDGVTYTYSNTAGQQASNHVAIVEDNLVTAISSLGLVYSSTDGVNFSYLGAMPPQEGTFSYYNSQGNYLRIERYNLDAKIPGNTVKHGNIIVSAPHPTSEVYVSTDAGSTWSTISNSDFSLTKCIKFINGKFLMHVSTGDGVQSKIYTSTNGIDWTHSSDTPVWRLTGMEFLNGVYYLAGNIISNQPSVVYSTNGMQSWIVSPIRGNWEFYIDIVDNKNIVTSFVSEFGQSQTQVVFATLNGSSWIRNDYPYAQFESFSTNISKGQILTLKQVQVAIGNQGSTGAEILVPNDIYVVPPMTKTKIDRVTTKNDSFSPVTYDLAVLDSGVSLSDQNALVNDQPIAAGQTVTLTSITNDLVQGQRIVALPSTVDSTEIKVYGTETPDEAIVVMSYSGNNKAIYSTDGISFTRTTEKYRAVQAVYNGGVFVGTLADDMGLGLGYSTDGINWTRTLSGYYGNVQHVGNKFIAKSVMTDAVIAKSTDGITWDIVSIPMWINDITYSNGTYVGTSWNWDTYKGGAISSTDLSNWSYVQFDVDYSHYARIVAMNGKFVIVGGPGVAYSTDGVNWNHVSMSVPGYIEWNIAEIVAFNNKFIVPGMTGYAYSEDAINWTFVTSPGLRTGNLKVLNNRVFLTFEDSGTNIISSSIDGINWTTAINANKSMMFGEFIKGKYLLGLYNPNTSKVDLYTGNSNATQWTQLTSPVITTVSGTNPSAYWSNIVHRS